MFNTSNSIPEEENRENNQEAIFKETMVKNFLSLKKTTDSQIQEAKKSRAQEVERKSPYMLL